MKLFVALTVLALGLFFRVQRAWAFLRRRKTMREAEGYEEALFK